MNEKISKTNQSLEFFSARLDEVQMSEYERLRAKASLARAEAVAGAVIELIGLGKRLLKTLVVRPFRRLTTSVG
jgi:hypothetical protein